METYWEKKSPHWLFEVVYLYIEAYSEPCQTSKMELFATESSISDVGQDSQCGFSMVEIIFLL